MTYPLISIDIEVTSGIDLYHGSLPFFVTTCDENEDQLFWEWDVDPKTRKPIIPSRDRKEIKETIRNTRQVAQNAGFDVNGLDLANLLPKPYHWKLDCTLLQAHLLGSQEKHDLTSLALLKLGLDVKPYEDWLRKAIEESRKMVDDDPDTFRYWKIMRKGMMPSVKGKVWICDQWLPRAVAKHLGYDLDHPWYSVLREYSNMDSAVTRPLYEFQAEEIEERGLTKVYEKRTKLLRVIKEMSDAGITYNAKRLEEKYKEFDAEARSLSKRAANLSGGAIEELPKGMTNQLKEYMFGPLGLPVVERSKKTGEPSTNKKVIEKWLADLPSRGKQWRFVHYLSNFRARSTALTYMDGYKRSALPVPGGKYVRHWWLLHPSLNSTGSGTLRFSSSNPNEQNISRRKGFNLRYCFGPLPGREWWAIDYNNIELRIPAYEANETAMLELFEQPNKAPFYGSYHLLVASILHPDKFEQCLRDGVGFKKRYDSTWYQWVKNGNFADQYGAVMKEDGDGTADRAYHVTGAQSIIREKLTKIALLNTEMIRFAQDNGYVLTMPDRETGSGYPIQCEFNRWGKVRPTVPLNYHVQGTAMWAMCRAMERVSEYLRDVSQLTNKTYRMIMQVHDELVFDFPKSYRENRKGNARYGNYRIIKRIKELMELSGDDLGLPLPASITYHPSTWDDGVDLKVAA